VPIFTSFAIVNNPAVVTSPDVATVKLFPILIEPGTDTVPNDKAPTLERVLAPDVKRPVNVRLLLIVAGVDTVNCDGFDERPVRLNAFPTIVPFAAFNEIIEVPTLIFAVDVTSPFKVVVPFTTIFPLLSAENLGASVVPTIIFPADVTEDIVSAPLLMLTPLGHTRSPPIVHVSAIDTTPISLALKALDPPDVLICKLFEVTDPEISI